MPTEYELFILGAGGIGSAAFYHAAKLGRRVLALDQFGAAHDRGSSHGQTRIICQAYFEHPNYVPLLVESYELWRELERRTDRHLFHETGLLEVGFADGPIVTGIRRAAEEHSLPIEEISDAQFAQRFPTFRKSADQVALFERNAGYLLVEQCVQAHIDAGVVAGGEFRPKTRVVEIRQHKNRMLISTDQGDIFAQHVVVTAGAWTEQLLAWLRPALQVRRKHQYWFPIADKRFEAASGCPTYFYETDDGHFYGFPIIDGGVAKVARHTGGDPVSDPTTVDRSLDQNDLKGVREFVRKHLNQSVDLPAQHSVCMYTMSPDEHFIVDRHPEIPQVVFCAGLSGHGFKFSPVLGRYLNTLVDGTADSRFEFLKSSRPTVAQSISSLD